MEIATVSRIRLVEKNFSAATRSRFESWEGSAWRSTRKYNIRYNAAMTISGQRRNILSQERGFENSNLGLIFYPDFRNSFSLHLSSSFRSKNFEFVSSGKNLWKFFRDDESRRGGKGGGGGGEDSYSRSWDGKKYELKWSGKRCRLWSFYFEEKDFENQRGVPRLFDWFGSV